ncbi:hypothetical protein [Abyssibacter profundi]|uniref:Uncharacterized protein n=1 Tax=Abyssibacter profundi TaxID=2182787 RepID=A0A363ULA8_9GAMM|nr:hypothetical protein [Abyssibacter profundi]PWN56201.1 hypothetical protein DEH80_07970 [Abyssibacter profundi]
MSKKKTCFVIAPIGATGSPARQRSDKVLKYVLGEVVQTLGYAEPVRADSIGEPGIITSQIIKHITDDDLVIADLTDLNPNVFYELAIRHMIGKPLVQIIEKGHKIPFDVAASRTIFIDHTDLESVGHAKKELKAQITAVENDPSKVDNPITVSLQLEALKNSEVPSEQVLGLIQQRLESIESAVRNIDGYSSLDDIMSKVEEIDSTCEDIESTVSNTEATCEAIQSTANDIQLTVDGLQG